ncbi:transglycosylase SLT domain-containing protein [Sulfitobacter pontiacus]|uniref:transglycosylase SLT domain-containing protein n=1 Tax=Sulfitobacter pontiacus TaxID=60137 RepID=UPI0030EE5D54
MANNIQHIIDQAARQYNVDPVALKAVAFLESGFDPSAKNPRSSASGLFQQIDSNAKAYGVKNRMDPKQSALGAARFMADNKRTLSRVLGREPNVGELYLAHQQGPGGASKLLRNPNAKAVDVVGADAVRLNGGNANMSTSEFASLWTNKAERAAVRVSNGDYTPAEGTLTGSGGSDTLVGSEGGDDIVTRDPGAIERTYKAFVDGDMTPQEREAYEADVRSGRMPIPTGMSIGEPINVEVAQIQDVYSRYINGELSDEQKSDYESDVRAGTMPLPDGIAVQFGQIAPVAQDAPNDTLQLDVPAETAPEEEPRGAVDEFGRQLGLTGRYIAQGAAGLAGVVTDPMDYLIAQALGTDQPAPLRQRVSDALTAQGVPLPETGMERVIGAGSEAMVGAGASVGAALGAGRALAPGVGQASAQMAATAPAAQVSGGLGAGVGQQATAEAGGGPVAQTVAALGGGMLGSKAASMLTTPDMPAPAPVARQTAAVDAPIPDSIISDNPVAEVGRREIGDLAFKAGKGNKVAQTKLAELAQVDPAAAQAAQRLGIDVPADVLGTNSQIDEIAGMIRTVKGSEASKQWDAVVRDASERASSILKGQGQFDDIASASDAVRRNLKSSIQTLDDAAGNLFAKISKVSESNTKAKAPKLLSLMRTRAEGLGGIENLNAMERKLLAQASSGDGMTYNLMDRLRREIGDAAFQNKGDYASVPEAELKQMYSALREDMMNYAEVVGSKDARKNLEQAFALKSQSHELRGKIVDGFGKGENGSIASLMKNAIASSARGDKKKLFDAIKIIPEDLRKDTLLSTLDFMSKSKSGANIGSFSFQEFNKTWTSLKSQGPIMTALRKELGPKAFETLSDLASVSKNIQRALDQTQVAKRTGASLTAEVFVDGLIARIMNAPSSRIMTSMAGGVAVGAATGPAGPYAAAGTQALLSSLKFGGNKAAAAAAFMNSPEFLKLAVAASDSAASQKDIDRVLKSPAFMRWSRAASIKDPRGWLIGALLPQQAVQIQMIEQ